MRTLSVCAAVTSVYLHFPSIYAIIEHIANLFHRRCICPTLTEFLVYLSFYSFLR